MKQDIMTQFSKFCIKNNVSDDVRELILELATVARSVQDDNDASVLVRKHANDVLERAQKLVCGHKSRCSINNQCYELLVANMMAGYSSTLPDDELLTGRENGWYC